MIYPGMWKDPNPGNPAARVVDGEGDNDGSEHG